jgi:translation initiation factor 3 subunit C
MSDKGRFWGAGDDESDSDTGEVETYEKEMTKPTSKYVVDSDTDSEDEVREVLSAKEKKLVALQKVASNLVEKISEADWVEVVPAFSKLLKTVQKAADVFKGFPAPYLQGVLALTDAMSSITKADKGRMSKPAAKAVTKLTSELKKLKQATPALEKGLDKYRELLAQREALGAGGGCDTSDSGSDSGSDSDSDSDSSDSDSSSSSGSSDSDSSSSDSESDDETDTDEEMPVAPRPMSALAKARARWVRAWKPEDEEGEESEDEDDDLGAGTEFDFGTDPLAGEGEVAPEAGADDVVVAAADAASAEKPEAVEEAPAAVEEVEVEKPFTFDEFQRQLTEITLLRGKRSISREEQITRLTNLYHRSWVTFDAVTALPVVMQLISIHFETVRTLDDCLSHRQWSQVADALEFVLRTLEGDPALRMATATQDEAGATAALVNQAKQAAAKLAEIAAETAEAAKAESELELGADGTIAAVTVVEDETPAAAPVSTAASKLAEATDAGMRQGAQELSGDGLRHVVVVGNLGMFLRRLADELTKALRSEDSRSEEYLSRILAEPRLMSLATRLRAYFVRADRLDDAAAAAHIEIECRHYKHDDIAQQLHARHHANRAVADARYAERMALIAAAREAAEVERAAAIAEKRPVPPGPPAELATQHVEVDEDAIRSAAAEDLPPFNSEALLAELAGFVYKHGEPRAKSRTILCSIYHHALHDRYYKARDLMLMSRLQEGIRRWDVDTQVLYNRALVQIGLCAFRMGKMQQAHACLHDIASNYRTRELLAQGMARQSSTKTEEEERAERRRQVPYHMHIHVDLLEAAYLVASMLLEIPNLAAASTDSNRREYSRYFRDQLRMLRTERTFVGPPEMTRDHVMHASLALEDCNWQRTVELIGGLKSWNLWSMYDVDAIKKMITHSIKEAALQTFMHRFAPTYDSMSLPKICDMFDLPAARVHSIVSRMMLSMELAAVWDQPTSCILMQRTARTKLQDMARELADRTAAFVDVNERSLSAATHEDGGDSTEHRTYGTRRWTGSSRWGGRRSGGGGRSGGYSRSRRYRDWQNRYRSGGSGGYGQR